MFEENEEDDFNNDGYENTTHHTYVTAYRKLPPESSSTVRFFDRGNGEKIIVYGKDAYLAANEIFHSSNAIKTYGSGEEKMDCVFLSQANFEKFLRELLLVKQYKVELYVSEQKGSLEWILKYKGSPGNLTQFEDVLFTNNKEVTLNNGVIGVKIGITDKTKMVGVAFVNMNEWFFNIIEFADNESLTNFESVLVQLAPKEAVISTSPSQSEEQATLIKILERNGVLVSERKSSDFDTKDINQDLGKLLKSSLKDNIAANPEMEKNFGVSALAGAIKYLELMSGDTFLGQFAILPFDFGLYVKMDSSACRALHLSQNSLEITSKNATTLLSVIDKCRTAQGHRMLAQWLRQPLLDMGKLNERLDIVEILFNDVVVRQQLHEDHLRRIPDCQVLAKKLLKKKATLQDCYRGYMCVKKLPKLIKDLETYEGNNQFVLESHFITPLKAVLEDLEKFKEMVKTTIDLDMADKGDFIVRSDFDPALEELRSSMDLIEENMADETYSVAKKIGLEAHKSLKLESNTQFGFVFRITLKDEKAIRGNKSIEVLGSTKSGVTFRTSLIEKLSESYRKKRARYEVEQKQIVEELIGVAVGYSDSFEELGNIVSALDVFTSFAVVAATSASPFVRPELKPKGSGILSFEKLRHPCVENQPGVTFIPNDIKFVKGENSFYIITGPNMGGKSTVLRSVGIATLLAHVGCFVPADKAEVSIVDAILARVGAGDCLTKGVSTFMAEMIETSFILKTATKDSLVLIDELGRGTSTYDGFGLCWAISDHLAKQVDCYCVMATHFHELTELAEQVKSVVNMHVSAVADENGLTMLYKLEKGPCDRSFGIHIAQLTKFPDDVVDTARKMMRTLETFPSDIIEDDSEEAVLKRRDLKRAGEKTIDDFMEKVQRLGKQCENDDSLKNELTKLLAEMEEDDNPFIKNILSSS